MRNLFIIFVFLSSSLVLAHSGRTDSRGGHHDRIRGGYHYHSGSLNLQTPTKVNDGHVDAPHPDFSEIAKRYLLSESRKGRDDWDVSMIASAHTSLYYADSSKKKMWQLEAGIKLTESAMDRLWNKEVTPEWICVLKDVIRIKENIRESIRSIELAENEAENIKFREKNRLPVELGYIGIRSVATPALILALVLVIIQIFNWSSWFSMFQMLMAPVICFLFLSAGIAFLVGVYYLGRDLFGGWSILIGIITVGILPNWFCSGGGKKTEKKPIKTAIPLDKTVKCSGEKIKGIRFSDLDFRKTP